MTALWTRTGQDGAIDSLSGMAVALAHVTGRRQAFDALASFVHAQGFLDLVLTIQTDTVEPRRSDARWSTLDPSRLAMLDAIGFDGHDPIRRFARRSLDPFVWTTSDWPGAISSAGRAIMNSLRQVSIHAGMSAAAWGRGGRVAVIDAFGLPERVLALPPWAREEFHLATSMAFRAIERVSFVRDCVELTEREAEILDLASFGLTARAIAKRLDIVEPTVKFHLKSIRGKLGARNTSEAIARFAALDVAVGLPERGQGRRPRLTAQQEVNFQSSV